jgi:hypothetical protein
MIDGFIITSQHTKSLCTLTRDSEIKIYLCNKNHGPMTHSKKSSGRLMERPCINSLVVDGKPLSNFSIIGYQSIHHTPYSSKEKGGCAHYVPLRMKLFLIIFPVHKRKLMTYGSSMPKTLKRNYAIIPSRHLTF